MMGPKTLSEVRETVRRAYADQTDELIRWLNERTAQPTTPREHAVVTAILGVLREPTAKKPKQRKRKMPLAAETHDPLRAKPRQSPPAAADAKEVVESLNRFLAGPTPKTKRKRVKQQ